MSSENATTVAPVDRIVNRRLAGLVVTGECVGMMSRSGDRTITVDSPVPETASFFTSYFDHSRNAYVCVFEDESFDPVAEGAIIPILDRPAWVTEHQVG